jgi:predicted nucleotidyltransferase
MTEHDLTIARQLKNRLDTVVTLVDFRIFGSRARGDADQHSDMDVFVEVGQLDKSLKESILDIAWEVGFENYIVISPLLFSSDELKNSPLRSSPIVKAIIAEGVCI